MEARRRGVLVEHDLASGREHVQRADPARLAGDMLECVEFDRRIAVDGRHAGCDEAKCRSLAPRCGDQLGPGGRERGGVAEGGGALRG